MPVFISYSHDDSEFVDHLAATIVKSRTNVWLDQWEINVGESMLQKVQQAISSASALLVVLSKAYVESEWCKKELNAGLMRELEEKRVIVLPLLIETCEIPVFLREKKYADFRADFEAGIKEVLEAIASVTNTEQSRLETPEHFVDWAEDWWFDEDGLFVLRFTIAESPKSVPLTILTEVVVYCNEPATRRYEQYAEAGLDWIGRHIIAEGLVDIGNAKELFLSLDDQFPRTLEVGFGDSKGPIEYHVIVISRRLGTDTGKIQVVRVSNYLRDISDYLKGASRKCTADETREMLRIMSTSPY
jgi:hypothetical protein